MKIILRKLWKGRMASIKDYEIAEARRKNENIELSFRGMKMVAKPEAFTPSGTFVESKVNPGQKYQLMDIRWEGK